MREVLALFQEGKDSVVHFEVSGGLPAILMIHSGICGKTWIERHQQHFACRSETTARQAA
jgi:hypothetical protein